MTDGTIEGADPSPLIEVSTILLQNHKKYAKVTSGFLPCNWTLLICVTKDFLPYINTLLRVALNRLHVSSSCLNRLIEVASVFRPKTHQEPSSSTIDIVNTLVEILSDGLKMKTKVLPLTIKCLIDVSVISLPWPLRIINFCRPWSVKDRYQMPTLRFMAAFSKA